VTPISVMSKGLHYTISWCIIKLLTSLIPFAANNTVFVSQNRIFIMGPISPTRRHSDLKCLQWPEPLFSGTQQSTWHTTGTEALSRTRLQVELVSSTWYDLSQMSQPHKLYIQILCGGKNCSSNLQVGNEQKVLLTDKYKT
jgi:hypothetical protein